MSKITIKITNLEITLEADVASTISGADDQLAFNLAKLAETLASLALPAPSAAAPVAMPVQQPRRKAVRPTAAPAQISPEPQIAPVEAAVPTDAPVHLNGHTEPPKKRLPFEEFDRQVRAEMKRLAPSPNTMPGHTLWNDQRAPYLPTMGGVMSRYDCVSLVELAALLGLNPPLGRPGPVAKTTTNGVLA